MAQPGGAELEAVRAALAGRYSIAFELGRGAMATVYLATDLRHQRQVAIKVLHPELAAAVGRDRFLQEVAIVARLNHPHILALHDSGEAGGRLYFVMPRVSGESLRRRLEQEGQLPLEDALRVTEQVASALAHAHGQGIIHRDLKPENILLHEGEAMLADFGIAALGGGSGRLTETGLVVGTPAYMSPEQSAGERELDGRSDVYSLASVLYEMLAGEPPFTGPTAQAVIAKRMVGPVPSVRTLRGATPTSVDHAIARGLRPAPADRYPSAAAFAAALRTSGAPGTAHQPSVAVLPFVNLSRDPDNEYFVDGMTEDVITQLSRIRGLRVIARTSAMQFRGRELGLREIGARLNAGAIVEGSVRRAGDRVRIVAQMADVGSEQTIWAETYDRQLTDIFAIQGDVALEIARALQATLTPDEATRIRREPTTDVEAYQLYLKGRHSILRDTRESRVRGMEFYQRALERDPGFALAHAALAMVLADLIRGGNVDDASAAYEQARRAAERAIELDPDLSDAHSVRAFLRMIWEYDWAGAAAGFQRAIDLNPGNADAYNMYGNWFEAMERHDEAIAMQEKARLIDPMAHRTDVATSLLRAGRNREAEEALRSALTFHPDAPRLHATLGWALLRQGRAAEGLAALKRATELEDEPLYLAQYGQALALAGQRGAALGILHTLDKVASQRYVSPKYFAYIHTGLGNLDRAMDYLEQSYNERSGGSYSIPGSFLFEPLRGNPRYAQLLARMNLGVKA